MNNYDFQNEKDDLFEKVLRAGYDQLFIYKDIIKVGRKGRFGLFNSDWEKICDVKYEEIHDCKRHP